MGILIIFSGIIDSYNHSSKNFETGEHVVVSHISAGLLHIDFFKKGICAVCKQLNKDQTSGLIELDTNSYVIQW